MVKNPAFLIISLLLISSFLQAETIRGMWVVRYALNSEDEIDNIISTSRELKITDLYVQVRALGQKFGYSTNINGNNPFRKLIAKAKLNGIKVHAWLNVLYVWSGDNPPIEQSHLFYKVNKTILRSANLDDIPKYVDLKEKGIEGYFIDPSEIINLLDIKVIITDLINTYDVDGIHLDYFRYPSLDYSFSPAGRTKFYLEYWFDPAKFFQDKIEYTNANEFDTYFFVERMYKTFLRNNLNKLLGTIRDYKDQINPSVELSVAVKPNLSIANERYFQDWSQWLNKNLCDRIIMMNYQIDFTSFKENVYEAINKNGKQNIIVGVSTYNQDYLAVIDRIKFISKMKMGGFSIFSYNYMNENIQYFSNMKKALFYKN